jgi:SRSO17 transposase
MDGLAHAAWHADRHEPRKDYSKGLLLPGERKGIQPMAARLHPDRVQAARTSLHHPVAKAPWKDEAVPAEVRQSVMPVIEQRGPIVPWIVDEIGIFGKGRHPLGVARQDCGQFGKQDTCQVAVGHSVATRDASLPVGWRLYLPEKWARDRIRRRQAGVPEQIDFETKPEIALGMIRRAVQEDVPVGGVLADAGYGSDTKFREGSSGWDWSLWRGCSQG